MNGRPVPEIRYPMGSSPGTVRGHAGCRHSMANLHPLRAWSRQMPRSTGSGTRFITWAIYIRARHGVSQPDHKLPG